MHELSLLTGVVEAVESAYREAGATAVEVVAVQVGMLSGAVPDALRGAWPLAVTGTVVQGAHLEIEEIAAAVWCAACGRDREIDAGFALVCPVCGAPTGALARGREFAVAYVEFTIPDASPG